MEEEKKNVHDDLIELEKVLEPIFDTVYTDTYFFVPPRLVWSQWSELIGQDE